MICEGRELSCRAVYSVRVLFIRRILRYLSFPTIWKSRLTQALTMFVTSLTIRLNSTWKLVTLAAKKKWHKSEGLYLNLFKSNCLKHGKLKRHFVFTITPFWNNSFLFCLIKPEAKIRIIFLVEMTLLKLRNTTFLSNPFLYHPHLHSAFVDLYVKGRSDI